MSGLIRGKSHERAFQTARGGLTLKGVGRRQEVQQLLNMLITACVSRWLRTGSGDRMDGVGRCPDFVSLLQRRAVCTGINHPRLNH